MSDGNEGARVSQNPPSYPESGTFAQLLDWHLRWGTMKNCSTSKQNPSWIIMDFARFVHKHHKLADEGRKNIYNWKNGIEVPSASDQDRVERIYLAFFDDNPNLQRWKKELERALDLARKELEDARRAKRRSELHRISPQKMHPMESGDDDGKLVSLPISEDSHETLVQNGFDAGKAELIKAITHHSEVQARNLLDRLGEIPYPSHYVFWQILEFHLYNGTRPSGIFKKWSIDEFTDRVFLRRSVDLFMQRRLMNYWITGKHLPDPPDFKILSNTIFGNSDFYDVWRGDFARALEAEFAKRAL